MFDPTCFFLMCCHLPAKEELSWSSGLLTGFQEVMTCDSSCSPPLSMYCFWICLTEMRDCYFLISFIFFYFFGQVWCWMETDALFRTWWGRKTQLRVNTLLVFIHKYGIVQEHQIHMEHCDWLLLMSFWCQSEVISMSPSRWTDQLSLFLCINSISWWHNFRALL